MSAPFCYKMVHYGLWDRCIAGFFIGLFLNKFMSEGHLRGILPLLWRHDGRGSVSDHQPHDCLLSHLFRRRPKKTSKLRITGLCAGNSSGTGEFPAQMTSNAESVSIWWRHHDAVLSWRRRAVDVDRNGYHLYRRPFFFQIRQLIYFAI